MKAAAGALASAAGVPEMGTVVTLAMGPAAWVMVVEAFMDMSIGRVRLASASASELAS